MGASPDTLSLDALIPAVLAGDRKSHAALDRQARLYANRVICDQAPDLPVDIREEIANQALANLLGHGAQGLTASSLDPRAFFRRRVIDALRQVRANYARAGRPTRRSIARTLVAANLSWTRAAVPVDFLDPRAEEAFRTAERCRDAATILDAAPPLVAAALRLICFDDLTTGAAAKRLGISRFALKRRLDRFAEGYRMAA